MNKLPMCRMCLVEDVRMYTVADKNLHELYMKLTDIPFVTEDRRPMLACFFCSAKLKQCYRFLRNCLIAEELFAQILNEDYEPNPLINQDHLVIFGGFVKTSTENISIVDDGRIESIAMKEELPAVCEGLDDIIEPKEEHQSYELELENFDNSCLDVADIPPHYSESDLGDDVPLMEFKTEVEEEQEVFKKKRRARETIRATVAEKPKLDTPRTKEKDAITAEQMSKDKSDSKVIRTTQIRTSNPGTYFIEPFKYDHRSISEKSNLTSYIRINTGENPFKCDICQRTFTQKSHLVSHTRVHTGEKPYTCDVCQRSFSHRGSLIKHIRIHTGEKPYKCDECQRSFSDRSSLTRHILFHTGEKPYRCDACQRSFSDRDSLTKHSRIHTGEKPFKCVICQRTFTQKIHLSHHIRVHTGEKPYTCDVCQRCFSDKGNLSQHIRTHTGEKPYKCDVCQHSFSRKSNFSKHIRIHTGEKPYKCDACQRGFCYRSSLTRHVLLHTREKSYKCDACQFNFSDRDSLTKHSYTHW